MDLFLAYATNSDAEEKGRWFENGDVEFLIARSGNREYSDMMSNLFTAHKHTLDQKDTPEARKAGNDRAEKITISVMARTVLLGWRGKKSIDAAGVASTGKVLYKGEELPFSADNAAKLLAHKDFRQWVGVKSDDFRNYLEAVREDDEKNSVNTSTGSSNGEVASSS